MNSLQAHPVLAFPKGRVCGNPVITISRQHGCGGEAFGRQLAVGLGLAYYDKQLLKEAVGELDLESALDEAYGKRSASDLLYNIATGPYAFGYFDAQSHSLISHKLGLIAFEAIRHVAAKGGCVIVGRCADFVLRENPDLISLFLHAPEDYREQEIADRYGLSSDEAAERVALTDRQRKSYYNYFTDREWGTMDNYHMALDVRRFRPQEILLLLQQEGRLRMSH